MGFSIIKHHKASKYWGTHWNLHVDFRHLRKNISCCKAEANISSLLHEQIDFRHHDITTVFPHSHQYFHCVLLGRACQCLFCPCWHKLGAMLLECPSIHYPFVCPSFHPFELDMASSSLLLVLLVLLWRQEYLVCHLQAWCAQGRTWRDTWRNGCNW